MTDEISDNLCDLLDAEYVPEEDSNNLMPIEDCELVAPPVSKKDSTKKLEAEEDFQKGRELLNRSAESMETAMNHLDSLAAQVETSSFWDAYAKVIGQSGILAKDLMELHQKKDSLAAFIDAPAEETKGDINIANAVVYTGTTADMQRQLKQKALDEEAIENDV